MSIKIDLSQVGAFRFVLPESRKDLSQLTKVIEKKMGEAILIHNEPVPGIYIVAEGEVGVYPPGLASPLLTMGPMSSFGEMSFLEKTLASATIRSESPKTTLVMLPHHELSTLIEEKHNLGKAIYQGIATSLSQKLRTTTERIARELGSGRQILLSLSSSEISTSLDSIPTQVSKQNDFIIDNIKTSAQLVEEITKSLPQKNEQLQALQSSLQKTKEACLTHYPKWTHQMTVMIDFVRRMEKFILRMTHD